MITLLISQTKRLRLIGRGAHTAQVQHQEEGDHTGRRPDPPRLPATAAFLLGCEAWVGQLLAAPDKLPEGRRAHLLEAVDHEEDVGVADPGFFPFAVHGVLTGGRKHLLEGDEG